MSSGGFPTPQRSVIAGSPHAAERRPARPSAFLIKHSHRQVGHQVGANPSDSPVGAGSGTDTAPEQAVRLIAAASTAASRRAASDVDDWTGDCPGDAGHALDLGNHQLAKFIHAGRLSPNDDVVRTRDIFSQRDALNGADGTCDVGRLADIGLDQDVRLYDHPDSFVAVNEAIRFVSRWPRTLADVRHATSFASVRNPLEPVRCR